MVKLTKALAKKLLSVKGGVKGVVFKTDADFIKSFYGADGLVKAEKRLKELGYPLIFKDIINLKVYPVGLRALSLLVIKEVFNLTDKDIQLMGDGAPKTSFIIRLMLRFLISLEKALSKAPGLWREHYTIGELIVKEINKTGRFVIIHLKDFNVHPIIEIYLTGYFRRFVQLSLPKEKVKIKRRKRVSKGVSFIEYRIYW